MTLDVLGLLAACSYALDCVEAELVHVTNNHSKRVAYECLYCKTDGNTRGKPTRFGSVRIIAR